GCGPWFKAPLTHCSNIRVGRFFRSNLCLCRKPTKLCEFIETIAIYCPHAVSLHRQRATIDVKPSRSQVVPSHIHHHEQHQGAGQLAVVDVLFDRFCPTKYVLNDPGCDGCSSSPYPSILTPSGVVFDPLRFFRKGRKYKFHLDGCHVLTDKERKGHPMSPLPRG